MKLHALKILPLMYMVTACGGDGEPATDSGNTGVLNESGLRGTLVMTYSGGSHSRFDLSTGLYTKMELPDLPPLPNGNPIKDTTNHIAFNRTVPYSGFVQTFPICNTSESYHESCVIVYSADGTRLGALQLEGQLHYPAKLSPDERFYVLNNHIANHPADSFIQIHRVSDNKIVHELKLNSTSQYNGKAVVEWGAAGEVIFTDSTYAYSSDFFGTNKPAVIYITEPYSLKVAQTIKLPAEYIGTIQSLDISPDGKKLLIEYESAALGALEGRSVFLLDLETLAITVPAIEPEDAGKRPLAEKATGLIRNAAWSPDGQWILLMSGFNAQPIDGNTGGTTTPGELSGKAYVRYFAVPADGNYIELGSTREETSPDAIPLFNYWTNGAGSKFLIDRWVGGSAFWLE